MSVLADFNNIKSSIFSTLTSVDSSQIFMFTKKETVNEGEQLYKKDQKIDKLYIVLEGGIDLKVDGKVFDEVNKGCVGEEFVIGDESYRFDAVAKANTSVLSIEKDILLSIIERNYSFKQALIESLLLHISKISEKKEEEKKEKKRNLIWPIIGWVLTLILPFVVYYLLKDSYVSWEGKNVLYLLVVCCIMWIFSLVPYFVPAVILLFGVSVLKIAPLSVTLSGFSSISFLMVLSIFAIGTALMESNVFYRFMLFLYRVFPVSKYTNALIILIISLLLAIVIPAYLGRLVIISSLAVEMNNLMHLPKNGKEITLLAIIPVYFSISNLFLTSSYFNFVILSFFSTQEAEQCTWLYWAFSASPVILVLVIFACLSIYFVFRKLDSKVPHEVIKKQMKEKVKVLGRMTFKEGMVIIGLCVFVLGIVTTPMFRIHPVWIIFFILYMFMVVKLLTGKLFQSKIKWSFVLLIGLIIGVVRTLEYVGVMADVIKYMSFIGDLMKNNFYIFVIVLVSIVVVAKIIVPLIIVQLVLLIILMPLCTVINISQWLIAFLILQAINIELMIPASMNYNYLLSFMKDKGGISKKFFVSYNYIYAVIAIVAICVSMPFWKWLGYF